MAEQLHERLASVSITLKTLQENLQCVICLETLKQPVSTRCGHTFCQPCISRVVRGKNAVCPLCNAKVNRRGIVENEKIKSLIQAVHVLISGAQKDAVEMGCEDLFALSKENKTSSRESFSPNARVNSVPASTVSGTKAVSRKSSRVETWLMDVAPTCPTQEASPTIDAENTPIVDSDSEMVSVSQIHPDETFGPSRKKPLSAYIEEDVDADERSSKSINVKPKPPTKPRATKKNISLKGKGKQESITNFLGKKKTKPATGSNTSSDIAGKFPELKIPEPQVVVLDREKENTSSPPPQRSPGWSRVNKMKKDFNPPRVLRASNSKSSNFSVPAIDDCASGDDLPCTSLTLDSPMFKRRAKVNEIVNKLESEIKICEKKIIRAENEERKIIQLGTNTMFYSPKTGSSVSSNQSRIRFYKLGSFIAKKQRRVPIFLKGSLEHSRCFDVPSVSYRLLVDAQTQTISESDKMIQVTLLKPADQKFSHDDTILSPPCVPRSQHRKSSEFDVDMMDAETVVFSQPIKHSNAIVPKTLSYDEVSQPVEPMDIENPLREDNSISQISKSEMFCKEMDPSPQRNFLDSRWLSQESASVVCSPSVVMSPKRVSGLESLSVINPTVDPSDSCSSVIENNRSKRSRTLATSSESSDSEVGVSKRQSKKKKRSKQPVLSDNEDSCNNQLDISTVDTEKIMANIEAELEESEGTEFSNVIEPSHNKTTTPVGQSSNKPQTFDDKVEVLSDTQNDSDADSELINPTPQKQTSFLSRTITHSDDVVPSSQPPGGSPAPVPLSFLQASSKDLGEKDSTPSCIPLETSKEGEKPILQDACSTANKKNVGNSPTSSSVNSPAATPFAFKPVFVCSSIPATKTPQVEKLALMVGGEFSSKFSISTTHLIVRVEQGNRADKTLKYLSAVACGKWVVSFAWVEKCLEAKKLIPEEPFEALDTTGEPGPRRSREACQSGQKLFKGFEFCCIGDFADLSKSQLEELLVECGGSVVPKPTDFSFQDSIVPICLAQWDEDKEKEYESWLDKYSSPLITHEWVLDCIGKFLVTSFAPMLLCDVSDDVLTSMGIPPHLFEYTETDQ